MLQVVVQLHFYNMVLVLAAGLVAGVWGLVLFFRERRSASTGARDGSDLANSPGSTTLTRAHMPSCPTLQYSWHGIRWSPGVANRVRTSETNPGTTMALTFVPAIRNPCTTSGLVTRNTIIVFAGTAMQRGIKEYCRAMTRTTIEPSA